MLIQIVERHWPAGAVHDSVQAVLRGAQFNRSFQSSMIERALVWIAEWSGRGVEAVGGLPNARRFGIGFTVALVLIVLARLLVAARARDPDAVRGVPDETGRRQQDSWALADRLAEAGDYEGAAHAMYRGLLTTLASRERLRLDPARTSGDYARELRRHGSPSHLPFRAFARRFDAAVYGRGSIDAALIDDLRGLARALREGARAA